MNVRWKSSLIALLIVVAGGVLRLPLEQRYTEGLRKQKLLEEPLNVSMRDKLGQTFFIAVLGGFRSVVASLVELKAFTAWQHSNWGVVDEHYAVCTALQPREYHYWEFRAHHLADNARDYYLWDSMLSEASRHALAQQYVEKGMNVLREGLTWLPDNWKLWDRLAWYSSMPYTDKPDHAAAAEYYAKAFEFNGLKFLWRSHVYQVARVPGREREAWDKLMALYSSPDSLDRTPTVEIELINLYVAKRLFERFPELKLPEPLALLINPNSVLTNEERAKADFLRDRVNKRANPGAGRQRAPRVESPNLQKVRQTP